MLKPLKPLLWLIFLSILGIGNSQQSWASGKYLLNSGDVISIKVFGEEDLTLDYMVGDSGHLDYPFLGRIILSGKTTQDVQNYIHKGLKGPYLVNPVVSVSIKEYRPLFVNGEVKSPGGIPYQPGLTLRKAISLAGGFTERASKRNITVIREGNADSEEEKITLDGSVNPGDVITVKQSFF